MPNDLRDRPVFICGHPKSGTSLLRSLLDSHPQVIVYPEETSFFRRYLPAAKGLSLDEKIELADRLLIHIFTWNQKEPPPSQSGFPDRDYSSVDFQRVRQAFRDQLETKGYRHDGDLLSAAVLGFGQATGRLSERLLWWVEKTPYNEYYAAQILEWWPQARCIHILRDPRDNFVSYERKHPDWTVEGFAANWRRSTQAGCLNQQRFGRDCYAIYRYEDLIQTPEAVLQQVRAFLGIEDHEILRIPTRNGEAWQGNSMFAEKFQKISDAPKERWKQKLSQEDAGLIGLIAAPYLKLSGYELPPAVPMRSRARWLRWKLASAAGRLKKS
ncbi:MAG: sulfotransferase family protein [Omnitrophica WOR_2 bacterium]